MSRHRVIDRPDLQVVLGFDHPLRSFFGQVFDPSNRQREEVAIDGWPTQSGLGTRRPASTYAEASYDVGVLLGWVSKRRWEHAGSLVWHAHLARVGEVLLREWEKGADAAVSPPIPAILLAEA